MNAWKNYQENAASSFRSLGLEASTDVRVPGVRTTHDVDVLVKSHHVGFDITWIVECKHWKTSISKLHVLALRQIVADTGVDRGIILSESGFQSGAKEAANLTNVQVTSIGELQELARDSINAMRLRELYDRVGICKDRYWNISKFDRIKYGLRSEIGVDEYSGIQVVEMCVDLLTRAFRGIYPFQTETILAFRFFGRDKVFESPSEVVAIVEDQISVLEKKLNDYDIKMRNA